MGRIEVLIQMGCNCVKKSCEIRDIDKMPWKLGEECGVFGIYVAEGDDLHPAFETYSALYALQHRGQESCGIATNKGGVISLHTEMGLVRDAFNPEILEKLDGNMAIGHCRYATTGTATRSNAQPIVMSHIKGNLALAHNGNLVNAQALRREIELNGGIFRMSNDSEVISYVIVRERLKTGSIEQAVKNAMNHLIGAYSLVIMSPRKLMAVRDPYGFRPLCIGKIENSYVFASETCALDTIGATFVRDVEPGEIVIVEDGEMRSIFCDKKERSATCIFEYIYFARPDSVIDGASVERARQEAGKHLAIEHPVEADIVIGVPDSGLSAAIGYSKESHIPYGVGLIKNRYVDRTFIQPGQSRRENAVRMKLNALAEVIRGKRVIMVDDSIVRGTTCARIVSILRDAGAKEVHMRVSSPPFLHPCFFGTDIPDRELLIAPGRTVEEIRRIIGVDSLGFLSIEATQKIAVGAHCGFCDACFTGNYPVAVPDKVEKNIFERRIGE